MFVEKRWGDRVVQSTRSVRSDGGWVIRREKRMSWQKFVMFIERLERVRCLDTGKVGSGLMCSEEMIGKWSEGENVRVGDKVELADVMTRSSVCECRCVENETC